MADRRFDDPLVTLRLALAHWPPLLVTAGALAAALVARQLLHAQWMERFTFLPFFPAVVVCAIVAGWRWGALATILSAAAIVILTDLPRDAALVLGIGFFLLSNAMLIALAESARSAISRAEAEAESAQESERRFHVMADSAPLMIWVHDAQGKILFVNRGWETFFGVTQEKARRGGWQALVHEEDRAQYVTGFQKAVRLKAPFDATARVRRFDGEWRWVESHGVPRIGPRGELISFVGTSYDITERRELEIEREVLLESERAARTEAEAATRAKDEFLATLSHELRTPLSVIVLWSRILARKFGSRDDELKKGLAMIIDNGMALSQLIGDLLDMSRIVSGRVTLDMKPLDAAEILAQTVASHRPAAEAKHIALDLEMGPQAKIVLGDQTRLQQVLWNLLANAVKFTRENGHIWVSAHRTGSAMEITVRDDGEGIPAEFLPHVFSRFRQADSSSARRHGGLGLGLAIVKQLVELHGGSVRVESGGPGLGATFTVTLPLLEAAMPVDIDSSGTWRRLDPDRLIAARLDGRRVLVVEDQAEMLESLRHTLEDQGAHVTAAISGVEAYAILRDDPNGFDALVSDIGMPQMDGYELIRRVRGELGLSPERLAAIAITAYARDEDRAHALKAGFQAHLAKPYQVNQLVTLVNQLTVAPPPSAAGATRTSGTSVAS